MQTTELRNPCRTFLVQDRGGSRDRLNDRGNLNLITTIDAGRDSTFAKCAL
jgi:hypothetical protein